MTWILVLAFSMQSGLVKIEGYRSLEECSEAAAAAAVAPRYTLHAWCIPGPREEER